MNRFRLAIPSRYDSRITLYDVPGLNIYEFKLNDGTQCVYGVQAGITCNWKGTQK